jgi:hypothetical protein
LWLGSQADATRVVCAGLQSKHRVDIAPLNSSSTDITGGYILDNEHGKTKQARAQLIVFTMVIDVTVIWRARLCCMLHSFPGLP